MVKVLKLLNRLLYVYRYAKHLTPSKCLPYYTNYPHRLAYPAGYLARSSIDYRTDLMTKSAAIYPTSDDALPWQLDAGYEYGVSEMDRWLCSGIIRMNTCMYIMIYPLRQNRQTGDQTVREIE